MFVVDATFLALIVSVLWSLTAIILRIRVSWAYWLVFVFPMSLLMSSGLVYFGAVKWLVKSISN